MVYVRSRIIDNLQTSRSHFHSDNYRLTATDLRWDSCESRTELRQNFQNKFFAIYVSPYLRSCSRYKNVLIYELSRTLIIPKKRSFLNKARAWEIYESAIITLCRIEIVAAAFSSKTALHECHASDTHTITRFSFYERHTAPHILLLLEKSNCTPKYNEVARAPNQLRKFERFLDYIKSSPHLKRRKEIGELNHWGKTCWYCSHSDGTRWSWGGENRQVES